MGGAVTRRLVIAALLVVGVVAGGLAQPSAAQDVARTFVGRVAGAEGLDALVAVVVAPDGAAVAYACSKDDAWNRTNSKWFTGQVAADGQLAAKAADGTEVSGTIQSGRLEGTLGTQRFTADLVSGGPAGLYRGRAGDDVHAVIEAQDGTRVGRVWSVVTGDHVGTWDFNSAQVQAQQPGVLGIQRNQPQFFFIELRVCTNAFCD